MAMEFLRRQRESSDVRRDKRLIDFSILFLLLLYILLLLYYYYYIENRAEIERKRKKEYL